MEKFIEKRNGAHWCTVELPDMGDEEKGSWEYMSDEQDSETYESGGLWFDGRYLVDYDGCYELPYMVEKTLREAGIDLSEL